MTEPRHLTHFSGDGAARMVDVSAKPLTAREARAEAWVRLDPATLALIAAGGAKKGDVLGIARLAGIQAAKRTSDLIPLCHPVLLTAVELTLELHAPDQVHILATTRCAGQTGVEMEALTAASVAALTLYDMCKSVDRGICIHSVRLLEKRGGKSGIWQAS